MNKMLKTGIPKLDRLVGGGLPVGSCILVLGSPKEKRIFSLLFIKHGLKEGHNCVFVSTENNIKKIEREIKTGLNFENIDERNERIRLIDCYSDKKNEPYIYSSLPETMGHLNVVITQSLADLMNAKPRRCVFNSISTLFACNEPEKVFEFIQSLKNGMKKFNATCILTLNEELQENKTIEKIKELVDVIVEIKSKNNRFLIRVPKIPNNNTINWTKIKLN